MGIIRIDMKISEKNSLESTDRLVIIEPQVVPGSAGCLQCRIWSHYCLIQIDILRHAWLEEPIRDCHYLTYREWVERCPRNVLRFEKTAAFNTFAQVVEPKIRKADLCMVENA